MLSYKQRRGWKVRRIQPKRERFPWFASVWPPSFFTYDHLARKPDDPVVDASPINDFQVRLNHVLHYSDDLDFESDVSGWKKDCAKVSLKDIEDGVRDAGTRRAFWIDSRNSAGLTGCGNSRPFEGWLTATGALKHLKKPRYNLEGEADAERRIICIIDLTPEFICTLAATAAPDHIAVLRDAIDKHIGFKPSIMAQILSDGILTFQLEYHLPYFILKKWPPPDFSDDKPSSNGLRKWIPITFLNPETGVGESYRLYETQVSCIILGYDDWHYTAYSFQDNAAEPWERYNTVDASTETNEDGETVPDEKINNFDDDDPVADGLYRSKPIWRPRQYLVKALEPTIKEIKKEWQKVVDRTESDMMMHKQKHPCAYSKSSQNSKERSDEIKASFDWTNERMEVLDRLINKLSEILEQWNAFASTDGGDIDFFSDLNHPTPGKSKKGQDNCHVGNSLRAIRKTFGALQDLLHKLEFMRAGLSRDFETLKLRLSLEGHETNEHASLTSRFLIWVLYPVTQAASIFSMQREVIPFGLTPFSFFTTVIILLGIMFIIYWIMKKWDLWKTQFTSWRNIRQHLEEGWPRGTGRENQPSIPGFSGSGMAPGDEESQGTRVVLGVRDVT